MQNKLPTALSDKKASGPAHAVQPQYFIKNCRRRSSDRQAQTVDALQKSALANVVNKHSSNHTHKHLY